MLSVYILNVGHGDSIVLEFDDDGHKHFAVIDSNCKSDESPKALTKLHQLGAKKLSFLSITHPHADHYFGVKEIMESFAGQIDNLYTFPIKKENLSKLGQIFLQAAANAPDSPKIHRSADQFIHFLTYAKKIPCWETPTGLLNPIVAPGFKGVTIQALLPPSKEKGEYFDQVMSGTLELEAPKQNSLSMAFLVSYGGHQILLGGDGTYANWVYQAGRWSQADITLDVTAAKLPHHGSKTDSGSKVLDIIFGKNPFESKIACISADGKSHPDNSVLNELISRGIKPYCTNLATRCGAKVQLGLKMPGVEPVLSRFITSVAIPSEGQNLQPCQGDILIKITKDGQLNVETEYKHLCPYRGDYSKLFDSLGVQ